jgi:hypothetical protein
VLIKRREWRAVKSYGISTKPNLNSLIKKLKWYKDTPIYQESITVLYNV